MNKVSVDTVQMVLSSGDTLFIIGGPIYTDFRQSNSDSIRFYLSKLVLNGKTVDSVDGRGLWINGNNALSFNIGSGLDFSGDQVVVSGVTSSMITDSTIVGADLASSVWDSISNNWLNVKKAGLAGDSATDDRAAWDAIASDSTIRNIFFPPGCYRIDTMKNTISNRSFFFAAGAVIDGIVYPAYGADSDNVVTNVQIYGELACSKLIETKYLDGFYFNSLRIVYPQGYFDNQDSIGQGQHDSSFWQVSFADGTKNGYVGNIVIDYTNYSLSPTTGSHTAVHFDNGAIDSKPHRPENIVVGAITVKNSNSRAVSINRGINIRIDNIYVDSYDSTHAIEILKSNGIELGWVRIRGVASSDNVGIGLHAQYDTNIIIHHVRADSTTDVGVFLEDCYGIIGVLEAHIEYAGASGFRLLNAQGAYLGNIQAHNLDTLHEDPSAWGVWLHNCTEIHLNRFWTVHCGQGLRLENDTNIYVGTGYADSCRWGILQTGVSGFTYGRIDFGDDNTDNSNVSLDKGLMSSQGDTVSGHYYFQDSIRVDSQITIGLSASSYNFHIVKNGDVSTHLQSTGTDGKVTLGFQNDARQFTIRLDGSDSDKFYILDENASAKRLEIDSTGTIRINDTWTLPMDAGSNGQVLTTDGSGAATWQDAGSGSGGADADSIKGVPVQDTTGNLQDNYILKYNLANNALEWEVDATGGGTGSEDSLTIRAGGSDYSIINNWLKLYFRNGLNAAAGDTGSGVADTISVSADTTVLATINALADSVDGKLDQSDANVDTTSWNRASDSMQAWDNGVLLRSALFDDSLNNHPEIGNYIDTTTLDTIQNAHKAVTADSAGKALQDASGNTITSTYETIANVAKIGDDTADYKTAYDSSQNLTDNYVSKADSGSWAEISTKLVINQAIIGNASDTGVSDSGIATHGFVTGQGYLTSESDPVWTSDSSDYAMKTWAQGKIHDTADVVRGEIGDTADVLRGEIGDTADVLRGEIHDTAGVVRGEIGDTADVVRGEIHDTAQVLRAEIGDTADIVRGEVHDTADVLRGEVHDTADVLRGEMADTAQAYGGGNPIKIDTGGAVVAVDSTVWDSIGGIDIEVVTANGFDTVKLGVTSDVTRLGQNIEDGEVDNDITINGLTDSTDWNKAWDTLQLVLDDTTNWNTAYGWGDHSTQNYLDNDDANVDTAHWNRAYDSVSAWDNGALDSANLADGGVSGADLHDSAVTYGKIDHSDVETNWLDDTYFETSDFDNSTIDTNSSGKLKIKTGGVNSAHLGDITSVLDTAHVQRADSADYADTAGVTILREDATFMGYSMFFGYTGYLNKINKFNPDSMQTRIDHASDYLKLPQFFSSWDADDSSECVDCDSSNQLHPAFIYVPSGLFNDAGDTMTTGYQRRNKRWLGVGPICVSDDDENPHIFVRDDHYGWHEFFTGPESTWQCTGSSAEDSIPIGYNDSTAKNPIYDLYDSLFFRGDAWSSGDSSWDVDGTGGHLSDQALFVGFDGTLYMPFRASFGSGAPDTHLIAIGWTTNGYEWSKPVVIMSEGLMNDRGDTAPEPDNPPSAYQEWDFLSPTILPDTGDTYEMWTVEQTESTSDSTYIVKFEAPEPDSGWRVVYSGAQKIPGRCNYTPAVSGRMPWHMRVKRIGLEELIAFVAEQPAGQTGGNTYLVVAVSHDDGISWKALPDTVLAKGTDDWNNTRVYLCDGAEVFDGSGDPYWEMYVTVYGTGHDWSVEQTNLYFLSSLFLSIDSSNINDSAVSLDDINWKPQWVYLDQVHAPNNTNPDSFWLTFPTTSSDMDTTWLLTDSSRAGLAQRDTFVISGHIHYEGMLDSVEIMYMVSSGCYIQDYYLKAGSNSLTDSTILSQTGVNANSTAWDTIAAGLTTDLSVDDGDRVGCKFVFYVDGTDGDVLRIAWVRVRVRR